MFLDIFKKKQNTKEFLFIGNRQHLRTEEELLCVNKEEAEAVVEEISALKFVKITFPLNENKLSSKLHKSLTFFEM